MTDNPELYVIVCTQMHQAFGPVVGLDLAIHCAQMINKKAGVTCVHAPVPFVPFESRVQALATLGVEEKQMGEYKPGEGQYL